VIDRLLQNLADWLGVEPAQAGEAIAPSIRFERPWPQWLLLLVVVGSIVFILWLYRREGKASTPAKLFLASLRIALVLMAIFMLSEGVLSVERTGLPVLAILVDDSASARIVDQYSDPDAKAKLGRLAGDVKSPEPDPTRLAVAKGLLLQDQASLIRELQKQHKVRLYEVSSGTKLLAKVDRPEEVEPTLETLKGLAAAGSQSRLGDGVRQVLTELRGSPPAALILLSDGQTTDGEPLTRAAELATRKGVPIYAVGLGSPEPARDLELADLLVDDVVFVDDVVRFQAKLISRGFEGQKVAVLLKELPPGSTDPKTAKLIETAEVVAPADGQPRRVELIHRPRETGERSFIIEIEPRPRELQVQNNRIERSVTVRKEKLKVLLVDSEPRYEFRYLKNFLEREPTIDLGVVLLSSDPEYGEQDRSALLTFPASKDDLFAYDVILFGDTDVSFLSQSQMKNMGEFVTEKGGGVLFIAGELFDPLSYRGTPLELLLPIELSESRNPSAVGQSVPSFRANLTLEGRASPIFRFGDTDAASLQIWQNLPESYWYFEAPRKKPAALVLAEHPTAPGADGKLPLIVYQFIGSGKSMFQAFDDTWRWRFRAGDKYFGRYWVQTIRFLARSRLIGQRQAEVQTDRRRYQRGQPIQLRVRFPNPGQAPAVGEVSVQIERKGQGPRRLKLKRAPGSRDVFEGILPQAQEGEYEVRLLPPPILHGPTPSTAFQVEAPAGEFERIQMNEPELIRIAAATGGKFYTPLTASTLMADLPKPSKVPLDTDPPIPLWNTKALLILFLTVITAEWILRKRLQMV
jgi:hypothetical protein